MYEPWPSCTTNHCAGVRLPGKRRCIAHAESTNRLLALEAITDGDPIDLRGVPLDSHLLAQIVNALPRGANGPMWERARLDGAAILPAEAPLDLSGHEFAGAVSLRGLHAQRPVLMRGISAENATFTGAVFDERLDAGGAIFRGPARFDEAEFPDGVDLTGARFGQHLDLRRTIAAELTLAGAKVGTDIDFSLTNIVRLDMQGASVLREMVFYAATVTDAVMSGITIGGQVFGVRARIAGWEPQPRRAVAGAQPTDWRPAPTEPDPTAAIAAPAWRAELLEGADPEAYRWVTVEEWVGSGTSGPAGGGVIGLQVCPWPTADLAGRPMFDEVRTVVAAADAEALLGLLAARLGHARPPRVGTVYAVRVGPLPLDRTLQGDELESAFVGTPVDITRAAREAAHAASMATVMRPLDPHADAALIGALAGGGQT